jgi:hypothetical protein
MARGAGNFSAKDFDINEAFGDVSWMKCCRTVGDYNCRYGLKMMAAFKPMLNQEDFADSDAVYLDGSRCFTEGRETFMLESCGVHAALFHQIHEDQHLHTMHEVAEAIVDAKFVESASGQAAKRRKLCVLIIGLFLHL